MKIERFKYHEKFCVKSTFLDTSIDVEGTLDPGETLPEAVAKAREEIIKSLPKEDNILNRPGDAFQYPPASKYPSVAPGGGTRYESIPTISKDAERWEILTDNIWAAESIEQLKAIKESNPVMPVTVMTIYNAKRSQLLSRPTDFTDGLDTYK